MLELDNEGIEGTASLIFSTFAVVECVVVYGVDDFCCRLDVL